MSSTVLYMSVSLDGFVTGPNEGPDNSLGDGGDRLHEWVFPGAEGGDFEAAVQRLRGVNRQVYDEFMSTGAVVAGRGTFEPAGGWGGDHHDGVPIYILSRNPAPAWAAYDPENLFRRNHNVGMGVPHSWGSYSFYQRLLVGSGSRAYATTSAAHTSPTE